MKVIHNILVIQYIQEFHSMKVIILCGAIQFAVNLKTHGDMCEQRSQALILGTEYISAPIREKNRRKSWGKRKS